MDALIPGAVVRDTGAVIPEHSGVVDALLSRTAPTTAITAAAPAAPGLYAWWAAPTILPSLEGPAHPADDVRLLYIGVATSLRSRLARNHLERTGGSTLRRTLAGLLLDDEAFRTRWTDRVVLVDDDETRLTRWMETNLRVSWCEHPTPREVEPAVIAELAPPLNVIHASGSARGTVEAARRRYRTSAGPRPAVVEPAYVADTRSGYDAIAESYAARFRTELDDTPLDRAVLTAFAEMVRRDHPDPLTVEVGSGPGGTTAYLRGCGLEVTGVDLSPAMVSLARRTHPEIDFRVGDMRSLDLPDASRAALVSWYSLIHIPEPDRPAVAAEFGRVLRPGGYLLVAFQVGTDTNHHDEAFGHAVSLDFHRLDPDAITELLGAAGFEVVARVVRAPETRSAAKPILQASLVARRMDDPLLPAIGGATTSRATTSHAGVPDYG